MANILAGSWKLIAWRRIADDGSVTFPLGENASGLLIYTANGRMAVQMTAADRPLLGTGDPLTGDIEKRATAYSSCLAYFGSYEVEGDHVVHRIEASLFPDWSQVEQVRPFTIDAQKLVLHTPPMKVGDRMIVNEMSWLQEQL
jgi:Lipocalin-like domain